MRSLATAIVMGLAAAATSAQAAPVLWSSAVGGNGHYYEYVSQAVNWSTALATAETFSIAGYEAYLATATSAAENLFMLNLVLANVTSGSRRTWLAGSDAETEGVWTWMAGPEAGTVFWNGGASGSSPGGAFADWLPGEPNSASAGEDYLSAFPLQTGDWNDTILNNPTPGYIVEYSALRAAVPEPGAWTLMILGFGAAGAALRRRQAIPLPPEAGVANETRNSPPAGISLTTGLPYGWLREGSGVLRRGPAPLDWGLRCVYGRSPRHAAC